MKTYQQITEARKLLDLPEQASLAEIKANYRKLLRKHHPDGSSKNKAERNEMTTRLTLAYKTIITYCNQYKFSFSKEEIQKYLPTEEWWFDRFGDDPLWSKGKKQP
jgi:preprotein translocase subunit Sec63